MFTDHSEPNQLYQERLRRADEMRLARQLRHQPTLRDRNSGLRRSVGGLLINAGLRMRGEIPSAARMRG